LTKIQNILPTIFKQTPVPEISQTPTLSANQQTKLTWSRIIETHADVPEIYKPFFVDVEAFPYTVFTPARAGFVTKATEKLICAFAREIYILEKNEGTFETQCYPIDGISHIEVKSILLDAHIKISGMTKQGVSTSTTIKFNSANEPLFKPILDKMRSAASDDKSAVQSLELDKFDHLLSLNFKFMNYARQCLLAGEKVIQSILQPEIRVPVFRVLGRVFSKTISPTHISILTDRELIVIREDEPQNRTVGRYGGLWNYIPLSKVTSLTLNGKDDDLLILSIQLPESIRLDYSFQASAKHELDQLLDRFNELTAK
jgi:hypothetical protein